MLGSRDRDAIGFDAPHLVPTLLRWHTTPMQGKSGRADDWQRTGTLRLLIDIRDGAVIETVNPLGGTGGDRFLTSLFPPHSGQFGGAIGRWLMAIAGLLPALFFITGLSSWILRRRRKTV